MAREGDEEVGQKDALKDILQYGVNLQFVTKPQVTSVQG
jgi:hypothetical protein